MSHGHAMNERMMLDKLWKGFIKFRDENEYRFPLPESRHGLPIDPGHAIIGVRLNKYLTDFFEKVLLPALGDDVHCEFLNLLLWDPFRTDSFDNWAMLDEGKGINRLGERYDNYLREITKHNLSMFRLVYNSLRKTVLELEIPKDGVPIARASYSEVIPPIGGREKWSEAKKDFRQLVRIHKNLKSPTSNVWVYYVPSLFNPKSPGTGIGGIILISKERIGREALIKVQTILDSVLSKIGVYYLYQFFYDQSLRSAISAIMTRNMSHNIGSHVTPRATVHAVRRRLEKLDLWPDDAANGLAVISELKGNLDEYTQRKADFLAEITTQPLMTTRPAFFYREVILPLVENTLMMDNIAANEGINYIAADGSVGRVGGIANRLRLNVRVNGRKLRTTYRCRSCPSDKPSFVYPPELPYSLTCPEHKSERLQIDAIENGEHDVEVELPGPLGEFAIYSFLENYIRNVAKHNKTWLGDDKELEVTIDVDEIEGKSASATLTEEQRDYYRIRVWDNVVDPDRVVSPRDSGTAPVTLQQAVARHADASIILTDGSLKREAWGIGEMKICAILLSGPRDFVKAVEERKLHVRKLPGEVARGRQRGSARMCYEFRLMKSKKICAVLPAWTNEGMRLMLRDRGIWIYNSVEHMENDFATADSISSFHFALFDCSVSGGRERNNILAKMRDGLSHLPFRVLALTGRGPLPDGLGRVVQPVAQTFHDSRLAELHNHTKADVVAAELQRWAWEQWLRWFLEQDSTEKTAVVNLYLDQGNEEEPTSRWAKQARRFNKRAGNVQLRVWSKYEPASADEKREIWNVNPLAARPDVPIHIIYDRHAKLKDEFNIYLRTNEHWSYILLDKHSPDFASLFAPRFPSLAPGKGGAAAAADQWTLPWEMAEAGLLRVLVIDERAAEFSLDGIERSAREALLGLLRASLGVAVAPDFVPVKWHLAWASRVYVCTHFGVGCEPEPLHDIIASRRSETPSLKVRIDVAPRPSAGSPAGPLDARPSFSLSVAGSAQTRLKADAILIHQGVLDEWRNRLSRDGGYDPETFQDAFLAGLRAHFPFVIVESGRGIPLSLSGTAKFLPFSLLQHSVLGSIVGKYGLARVLMPLARRRKEGHE